MPSGAQRFDDFAFCERDQQLIPRGRATRLAAASLGLCELQDEIEHGDANHLGEQRRRGGKGQTVPKDAAVAAPAANDDGSIFR